MSKLVKRILLGLLAALVIIQFFRIDKTNPPVEASKDFLYLSSAPLETAELIKTSCYDCHSHETAYPWYTNIAPLSWWVKHHINEGREHLNFSTWAEYNEKKRTHKLEECAEEVEEGHMPISSYLWVHSKAKLTSAQREELAGWFEAKTKEPTSEEKAREKEKERENLTKKGVLE